MIYKGFDTYLKEEGEPALRSCWECNPSHEHLKKVDSLFCCFVCGRLWTHGRFLDSFKTTEELDSFLEKKLKHASKNA